MQVHDIMTREVVTVRPDTLLSEAASLMETNHYHGLPVVDDHQRVVGIVTEIDFFTKDSYSLHLPSYMSFLDQSNLAKAVSGKQKEVLAHLFKAPVSEIMSGDVTTVQPDMSIVELAALFREKRIQTLPVTDAEGILVGVVTVYDMLRFFGTDQTQSSLAALEQMA